MAIGYIIYNNGEQMKVGDMVKHVRQTGTWGIVVAVQTFEYEVYWMDGLRSWTRKTTVVKKCP